MTLGVRILVHDRAQNSVLLVKHTYVPGWYLPGGGVERGETALSALERELREETGIAANNSPILRALYFNRNASYRDHVALYVVDDFRTVSEFAPTAEISAAAFFPVNELPEDITPASQRRIDEMFGEAEISQFW